jgi:Tol biopolymer transport system component
MTPLGLWGVTPRWSPVADSIAYVDGGEDDVEGPIYIIAADGSGKRRAAAGGRTYHAWLDWSPDGRYLIGISNISGLPEVIDVRTGVAVPLPFARQLTQPAWKR